MTTEAIQTAKNFKTQIGYTHYREIIGNRDAVMLLTIENCGNCLAKVIEANPMKVYITREVASKVFELAPHNLHEITVVANGDYHCTNCK